MCNVFFKYLKKEDRVLVENDEQIAKIMAIRNGKKVANSDKLEEFKVKFPLTVLAVTKCRDIEIIQVKKDNGKMQIVQGFNGKAPFRNRQDLERFYVFHCISVNPYRKHLEKLFDEAGGNGKLSKEELDAFMEEFNHKHRVH